MSKKEKVPAPPATPPWIMFAIIALLGVLLGAALAYIALRPPMPSPGAISGGTTNPDPTTHRPAPGLTEGQPPALADRTLGNFYYDHQNWPKAIEHYLAAIRQGSDDADIRTDLGNVYRFTGRRDDALAQYTLAQQMDPTHEFSLFNQGGLYLEGFDQPGKAVEIWQEYLTRFPSGRNVDAAHQLIARSQDGGGRPALPAPADPTTPATASGPQTSAAEDLILRQIQAAKTKAGEP